MAKLPLYELLINEDEETGVDFIALVDSPAIEYDWVAFESQFETYSDYPKAGEDKNEFISRCISVEVGNGIEQDQAAAICYTKWDKKNFNFKTTDKQIISGAAMIPDKPIYRRGKDGEEYNVVFSKETIQKIVERYFKNQYGTNFNLQHKKNMLADGVYLIESFIIDSERGIKTPEGFDELPDGSWFISCKVDNEEIWNDYIKSGKFKGFSVEGLFTDRRVEMVSNVQEAIALIDKLQLNKTNIYTNNMSDVKVLLSKLKEIFTEEAPMSFEEAKLADGLTIIKWEGPLAEGTSVMVVSESGEVPAPDGEHELQDGRKITVENGKVTALEVPEVMPTEEEPSVEVEIEAKEKMAEDYLPMIEAMGAKIMKMEEMLAALEAKIAEKMGATEEKMNTQKDAFSKLVEIVEKLADAPSEVVEAKPFNVNFQAEKDNQYNKLNDILNILNK